MLIIVIVTIIAAAATIGLSIWQAAATAKSSGLDNHHRHRADQP